VGATLEYVPIIDTPQLELLKPRVWAPITDRVMPP